MFTQISMKHECTGVNTFKGNIDKKTFVMLSGFWLLRELGV